MWSSSRPVGLLYHFASVWERGSKGTDRTSVCHPQTTHQGPEKEGPVAQKVSLGLHNPHSGAASRMGRGYPHVCSPQENNPPPPITTKKLSSLAVRHPMEGSWIVLQMSVGIALAQNQQMSPGVGVCLGRGAAVWLAAVHGPSACGPFAYKFRVPRALLDVHYESRSTDARSGWCSALPKHSYTVCRQRRRVIFSVHGQSLSFFWATGGEAVKEARFASAIIAYYQRAH